MPSKITGLISERVNLIFWPDAIRNNPTIREANKKRKPANCILINQGLLSIPSKAYPDFTAGKALPHKKHANNAAMKTIGRLVS
jgi:hypothetical protein